MYLDADVRQCDDHLHLDADVQPPGGVCHLHRWCRGEPTDNPGLGDPSIIYNLTRPLPHPSSVGHTQLGSLVHIVNR